MSCPRSNTPDIWQRSNPLLWSIAIRHRKCLQLWVQVQQRSRSEVTFRQAPETNNTLYHFGVCLHSQHSRMWIQYILNTGPIVETFFKAESLYSYADERKEKLSCRFTSLMASALYMAFYRDVCAEDYSLFWWPGWLASTVQAGQMKWCTQSFLPPCEMLFYHL